MESLAAGIMKQDNRFTLGGGMTHKIDVVIVSNRLLKQ